VASLKVPFAMVLIGGSVCGLVLVKPELAGLWVGRRADIVGRAGAAWGPGPRQLEVRLPPDHARAQRTPKPRQQRSQRGVRQGRGRGGPEHVDQLVAPNRAVPARRWVGEEQAEPARQAALDGAAAQLDDEPATVLNPRLLRPDPCSCKGAGVRARRGPGGSSARAPHGGRHAARHLTKSEEAMSLKPTALRSLIRSHSPGIDSEEPEKNVPSNSTVFPPFVSTEDRLLSKPKQT
jgi:hypothetical protein